MKASGKKHFSSSVLLRLTISLVLIAGVVWWFGGLREVIGAITQISFRLAVVVVIVAMLDRALMAFKWARLLGSQGIHLHFLTAMKIYCASMVWGMFLPATVGRDSIRAAITARSGIDISDVIASIVVERMFGFLAALLLGLCSLILFSLSGQFEARFAVLWFAALAMIAMTMMGLAASFSERMFHVIHDRILGRFRNNRLADKLRRFHETYRAYRNSTRSLATFFLLTFVEQCVPIVEVWLISMALDIHVGLLPFAMAMPLSMLVTRIPIGIAGLGTFEASLAFFLSLAGITGAESVAIAFTGRILQTLSWLPWWFAYIISTRTARTESEKAYPKPVTPDMGRNL